MQFALDLEFNPGFNICVRLQLIVLEIGNLVPRVDFVLFRFNFTEQYTLETTPGINQFDWLMTSRLCHKLTVWSPRQ